MAHIFKHPNSNGRGIIILSHKEIQFLYGEHSFFKPQLSKKETLLKLFSNKDNSIIIKRSFIESVSKKYFIGVHFGWKYSKYPTLPLINFYMGSPSTVSFQEPNQINYIPMDGSSFIPSCFYLENPKEHPKIWDIIMVSRDVKWKNLDKFLLSIRKLYDSGNFLKVILVVPSNNDSQRDANSNITYTNLLADYEKMFSYSERGHFTILKTHPKMPFLGLAQPQIAKLYHLSKTFALFSEEEGGSRVISEALLAGLPVVVKSNLSGGGQDFLNEKNSNRFTTFEDAHLALERTVNLWQQLNTDQEEVIHLTREDKSLEKLNSYFHEMYSRAGEKYDFELINTDWLSFRLNSHWHEGLEWARKDFPSPDIATIEQLQLFKKNLYL